MFLTNLSAWSGDIQQLCCTGICSALFVLKGFSVSRLKAETRRPSPPNRLSRGLKSIVHRTADVLGGGGVNKSRLSGDASPVYGAVAAFSSQLSAQHRSLREGSRAARVARRQGLFVPLLHVCAQTFGEVCSIRRHWPVTRNTRSSCSFPN